MLQHHQRHDVAICSGISGDIELIPERFEPSLSYSIAAMSPTARQAQRRPMIGRAAGMARTPSVRLRRGEREEPRYAEGALGTVASHTLICPVGSMFSRLTLIQRIEPRGIRGTEVNDFERRAAADPRDCLPVIEIDHAGVLG